MVDSKNFFAAIKKHPERFYLIHYSSQSLFDADSGAYSPRITSIVVMHVSTQQTVSFALHAVAESMAISTEQIEEKYNEIEKELLSRFYNFVRDRREKFWVHWNMRNLTYGFEHLEHRYRVLNNSEPPAIPVEVRLNLNDILRERYGDDYVTDPKMLTLMSLNGQRVPTILTGEEESAAFKDKQFIRMNTSTISKVSFFKHVIEQVQKGKLKTQNTGFFVFVDKLLDSRIARVIAFISALLGLLIGAVWIWDII